MSSLATSQEGMIADVASVPPMVVGETQPLVVDRDGQRIAKVWNDNYRLYLHMWGTKQSKTAKDLHTELQSIKTQVGDRRLVVADFGCGYGRDTIYFAGKGYDATGVDVAIEGLTLAQGDYEEAQRHSSFVGTASFIHGTIASAFAGRVGASDGKLDGISVHRTLHLIAEDQRAEFARNANDLLRSKGIISIGARSIDDFDPARMHWVKEGISAEYHDRPAGHIITFVSKEGLKAAFGPYFHILEISEGSEPEKKGSETETKLIFLRGQKKNGDSHHHLRSGPN